MSDSRIETVMRTWMNETPAGQPDRSRVVGTVITQLGSTRRRRRRLWPFSTSGRSRTSLVGERHDQQPDPILTIESQTASVTGRTRIMFSPAKVVTAGALALALGVLYVAQPLQRGSSLPGAETDVVTDDAAMAPALSTGRLIHMSQDDFTENRDTATAWVQRGRTTWARSQMSDPRLTGEVVLIDNADRFFEDIQVEESYRGDVLWGTIEITNDDGTWTGTGVGTTDTSGGGGNITYYELVGSGGYEGLSAVIFEREGGGWTWDGMVFPGNLPPDR